MKLKTCMSCGHTKGTHSRVCERNTMTFEKFVCMSCFYLFHRHYTREGLCCPRCASQDLKPRGNFTRKPPYARGNPL